MPRSQAICAKREDGKTVTIKQPLDSLDKHVCFSTEDWEKVQNYIDELEASID